MNSLPETRAAFISQSFAEQLAHHLQGIHAKIENDFSQESFDEEIASLCSDPLYPKFNLNTAEYALIRRIGRVSISIGRRLGEIYDKLPRLVASIAFNIPLDKIAPKLDGKLELDTSLPFNLVTQENRDHISEVVQRHIGEKPYNGIGIEVRYNFNPNDSARLRKDVDMAQLLLTAGLTPVYLVFSSISPRDEAIERLKRAGWNFLIGNTALDFTRELYSVDLLDLFNQEGVQETIKEQTDSYMRSLFQSYAFRTIADKYQ